jgi:S-adenosylmethionine:tRNA ribosyltransferase-isomerase
MDLAAFDFHLPAERIAQEPLADRAAARMLVVHRAEGRWEDRAFRDFPAYLCKGDCLVLNDSRVFPARLYGTHAGTHAGTRAGTRAGRGGEVEVFLLRACGAGGREWTALVRPGRRLGVGGRIRFADGLEGEITGRGEFGERTIRFESDGDLPGDLLDEFERIGHVPLPPYIKRGDQAADRERYQTVFARERGSVAAPTAGLHFTPQILEACRARGADVAYVTLHVGLGTFQPLHEERVERAKLHSESYRITDENAALMSAAKRLVCAGTTSVRTVESALQRGELHGQSGETDIFIYPGYQFRGAGAMLTNFHLPRTSLLLLVCAFAGTDLAMAAYRHAVEAEYRFYSYGDCMLIV